jgi:hypothetical protein
MVRIVIACTAAIVAALSTLAAAAGQAADAQPAGQVSAADAAPFIGDWTLALESPDGPREFELTVKMEKDKVVGEISAPGMATHPISDITKPEKDLVLRYSFDYEGNPVPTVVSLTPAEEGKIKAYIDFAGGAYVMSGTGTRKEKTK